LKVEFPQRLRASSRLLLFAAGVSWAGSAMAFQPFTVHDIRAEGLQRLDLGTVLTYLPLSTGDRLNTTTAQQAIRALYASGLFQNVELLEGRDNTLIVKVKERPQIADFSIKGNEKIGGDKLKKSLKNVGLTKGALFKRDLLDQFVQELRSQYYANGYYAVDLKTTVTPLANNRIDVKVRVGEGEPAHIRSINILGNTVFSEQTLLDQLKLQKENHWNPFQSSDHYSREELVGDLETLQSYYQDRGYLTFNVAGVQVALSPDKKSVYITIEVTEGKRYHVSGFRFSGHTILNTKFLSSLVLTHKGDTFSRKQATQTSDRIEGALSDIGYAFAKVEPVPIVNKAKREVEINYQVDPGPRVYVRHVKFDGAGNTNDYVFRREMRQLEAAPFSKAAVERSRIRLQRLPFIQSAAVKTTRVPGTKDQVDVTYSLTQRAPGSIQFGIGYSGAQGFLISGSVTHTNFLGTGNQLSLTAQDSQIARQYSFSWTNPYFTPDGISQTASVSYLQSSGLILNSSGFNTNTLSGSLLYGIPLSEYSTLQLGGSVGETSVSTFPTFSSNQILQFVINNGTLFHTYKLKTGIVRDTRNRTFFATRGLLDSLRVDVAIPGSTLEYYSANFEHEEYFPLLFHTFIQSDVNIGYVGSIGSSRDVPPWEHLFAGGPQSVRGFRTGYLGPLDSLQNPYGGRLLTTAQNLLVIPLPIPTDQKTTRFGVFFDIGNAFAQANDFRFGQLRQSTGIALQWFTPIIGLLNLSYAFPLKTQPGDQISRFQITFGSTF
jgi:outer membrane protein assembly complex, YaeT protein